MAEPVGAARLPGSGTVPRVLAALVLVAITIFNAFWLGSGGAPLAAIVAIELFAVGLLVRSFFLGVFLAGDAVIARTWFRDVRYGPGELGSVEVVPYWKFLDRDDPILSLLKFRPTQGWVRELGGTVAWKDRTMSHAAAIRRHLGLDEFA